LPILKVNFDVDYASNLKRTKYYLNRLQKIAEKPEYKNKILFAAVKKSDFGQELEKFGYSTADQYAVYIDDHSKSLKYRFTGKEYNVDGLQKFVDDFLAGSLKPWIKSAPIPESQGDVKVVVGENFNSIVLDPSKDVLFEMYAPWCGHCKKLEPIYEELAKKVSGIDNLVIAKMDATANDSPHAKYQAKGYPTIMYAPADKKDSPIAYSGERDVKTFLSFLQKHGTVSKNAVSKL